MRFSKRFLPEKVLDKKSGRPLLSHVHLNVDDEMLEATDRKSIVRIPVEVEPDDVSGLVSTDALSAGRKDERLKCLPETLETDEVSFKRPEEEGAYPDLAAFIPADDQIVWRVGLSVQALAKVSAALAADEVVLEFVAGEDDQPSSLKGIRISPLGRNRKGQIGLLMPVRPGTLSAGDDAGEAAGDDPEAAGDGDGDGDEQ